MKLLKISDNSGHYLLPDGSYVPMDKLTKEDLLRLVNLVLAGSVEFDAYDEKLVKNQAHQIIYKSVYEKLKNISERREEFLDESARQYLKEYERYKPENTATQN